MKIEKCDMEFPFKNNDDAAQNDCFTNLASARIRAGQDIRGRIATLQGNLIEIENTTVSNVTDVPYIRGT